MFHEWCDLNMMGAGVEFGWLISFNTMVVRVWANRVIIHSFFNELTLLGAPTINAHKR